jgi:hypothetical protein
MFSKFFLPLILVLSLLSMSCSKWLDEEPKPNNAIELDKDETRCLRNWSDIMDRYLTGSSSRYEIEDFWNCLDAVFTHFQVHYPGNDRGEYKINILAKFVTKFFLRHEIPSSFVERFKDLKRAIFSGDREKFTPADMAHIHMMLGEFKYATSTMLPHMKLLNFSAETDAGLDAAIADLENVTERWTKKVSTLHESYKLEDLFRFWSELKELLEVKVYSLVEEDWRKFLKAAKRIKSLIMGAPEDKILQTDWPLLYQRGSDAYVIALLYHYRLKDKPWNEGRGVFALKKTSELILRGLRESIRRHPNEMISSNEFVELAQIVSDNHWADLGDITIPHLKSAIIKLFTKILHDPKAPNKTDEAFLTAPGLVNFESEIGRFIIVQAAINEIFANQQSIGRAELIRQLESIRDYFENSLWAKYQEDVVPSITEIADVLRRTPYLTGRDRGRQILFSRNKIDYEAADLKTVSHVNWMTRVARLIFYGYGENQNSVSAQNFNNFYFDFRDFGIDLGLLDPSTKESGARTAMEADTFTEAATGDSNVSKLELVQELQILLNGGVGTMNVQAGVLEMCEAVGRKCSSGKGRDLQISVDAVEKYLFTNFNVVFASLPTMVNEYRLLNTAQQTEFVRLIVAESQRQLVGGLNVSQIRYIVGLLTFAESIVLRYDHDQSELIDANEVYEAFLVFQRFLESAISKDEPNPPTARQVFVGFAYFLKYGENIVEPGGGWWGSRWWAKLMTSKRFWSMDSELKNNSYRLRRSEIVRAMIRFRNFGSK